ncbi:fibronectin type III domain-containing protein [Chryseolinea lacunae]|uniref:Fibronectin type III domain-containing protein n=1 Tax=Chryseolinea lacunae TaxID=2801331 RepID=A0ABS1KK48_9BACT|nr:fibronectin type III domain-containing protein [Chryseolinea lacunae]MBL0739818.1 fibronectin type III domain-containing protein [Chryseolinea lacunae]
MKKIVLICGMLVLIRVLAFAQPIVPGGFNASTLSATGIVLNWTDLSSNETGFQIERSTSPESGFALVATTGANTTTYINNTGLASGKAYYYRVRATNASGASAYTPVVTATTGLRRFLIDFGSPSVQTTVSGWNNVTTPATGTTVSLVESTGAPSSLSLLIVKDPSNGYAANNTSGSTTAVLDYPVSAVSDSHFGWGSGGSYRISGLDNSKVYNLRIFGSRLYVGDSRKGTFTINGQQQILETANNTSQTIVFKGMVPVSGTLTINFAVATGSTFTYINVLDIVEEGTAIPPAPQALTAMARTSTQVNLAWTDASANETGFQIERSSTSGAGYAVLTTTEPNTTTYSDINLTPGTTYYYRVKAVNAEGSSSYTAEVSATTLVPPPAAPTSLTANAQSASQVDLGWTDNADNETAFQLERSLTATTGFALVATLSANVTTYSDATPAANTTYHYRVRALNAGGNSAYSAEVQVTTLHGPPATPTLAVVGVTSSQVSLSWTESGEVTAFQLERSATSGSDFTTIASADAKATVEVDTNVLPGTQYFYRLKAVNEAGSSAYSVEVNATTLPLLPAAPTTLVAEASSATQIDLTWQDGSDNETGFEIERSLTEGSGFVRIITTAANTTHYSDTGLAASTSYFYRVKAVNAGGSSASTPEATAITLAAPPASPASPSAITATAVSSTQINLNWQDVSSNETGFQIERSLISQQGYTLLYTARASTTSYNDTGLAEGTTYYYRLRAINATGSSSYTPEANATTLPVTQAYGQIFSETAFSSATRFPTKGTGISRDTDKLVLTGNPSLFSSYIYHDDPANPFRYTCLENWNVRVRVKTPSTLNASSYGIGIGVQSVNTADPYSTTMRWGWDSGQNFIYLYYKSTTSLQMVSTTKYVPTANTYYWVEVTRAKDAFTYTIFDGATGKTQLFTTKLTFPTFTAGNYVKAHNTGQFCLHQFGGTNSEVTNWEVSTTAMKNADYIGVGDSNMHGLFASSNSQRWIESAMTSAGKSFNILAGISDRSADVVRRIPEVIALKPKAVVLSIGRNDLANGVALSTVQANIDYIINTLQSAGITVNLAGVVASNVNVSALQAYYNGKPNVQVNGYTATKASSGTTLNGSYNSGDNIHLNQAGNTAMSKLLLTILTPQSPPAAPATLSASSVSSSQINLTWTDNASNETGFQIERSLTTATGFTLVATTAPNTNTYANTGLAASTKYYYRIRAVNGGGNSSYTAEASATTQGVALPAAPTTLKATAASATLINLSWTDASSSETGFQIERSLTTGAAFAVIATTASNVTTYADNGVSAQKKYFYRIKAVNSAGGSAYTTEVSATTTPVSAESKGGRRFLIDFGSPGTETLLTGWNNVTSPATGSITNLVESTGASTTLSFEIVKDPSNGYGAYNAVGSTQPLLDYPVSAVSDSHYGWGAGGSYRINGLDNGKLYSLRIFGSRMSVGDSRIATFTINGQQQLLETANNTTETIVFADVAPTSGTITLAFNVASGSTFTYINVLDISESTSSGATSRVPANTFTSTSELPDASSGDETGLQVYPNPAADHVNIKANDAVAQTAVIQIVNLPGVSVYDRATMTNQNEAFDVRSLSPGMYIIRVKVGEKYCTGFFVRD